MEQIGIAGIGTIGGWILERAAKAGYKPLVYDIDPKKNEWASEKGFITAPSLEQLLQDAEIVFFALPDTNALEEALEGGKGLIYHLREGQILIDSGTSRPDVTRRYDRIAAEKGAWFLDSPVTRRGPGGAHIRMTGGREEGYKKAEKLLRAVSCSTIYAGPAGSGQLLKLLNQMLLASESAVYAEAVQTAAGFGFDPRMLKDYLHFDIPEPLLSPERNYADTGQLAFIYKDLGYLSEVCHEKRLSIPLSATVHEIFKASAAYGEASWHHSGIRTYYERLNRLGEQE